MDVINWNTEFSKAVEENKHCLYDIFKACMDLLIENSDSAQEGFQYFLNQVQMPRYNSDEIPEGFFNIEENEIDDPTQMRIREMESQIVKELIFQDVSEKVFYGEIWKRMSDPLLVSDSYQKSYFLLRMWLDSRVPYYQLGLGVNMSNEAYKKCVQQVNSSYKKMLFAMNAGYPQKTQKASILMKIAEEIPSQEQRIVFWALTLGRLERQIIDLKQQVKELKSRLESDNIEIG